MKKSLIVFAVVIVLLVSSVSASLCRGSDGHYRDCFEYDRYDDWDDDYYDDLREIYDDYYDDLREVRDDYYDDLEDYYDDYDNYYGRYDYRENLRYNDYYRDDYYDDVIIINGKRHPKTTTYYITYPSGRSHYRTYTDYNKDLSGRHYNRGTRKGIFLDFFDSGHIPSSRERVYLQRWSFELAGECPPGWQCISGNRLY